MKNREIDQIVAAEVHSRIERLSRLPAESLHALPSKNVEELKLGRKKLEMCTFKDSLPNSEILIIVQCMNSRMFAWGRMAAEGIVVDSDGRVRQAEEQLMWEYV